ncbi:hypothetical protein DP196_12605 [Enterobacter hormaechei subsp. steigerwaltii]|nr:hypothetical protein DP196_12605 [Enterobacter hormaechei subsp. steigerwaltii]
MVVRLLFVISLTSLEESRCIACSVFLKYGWFFCATRRQRAEVGAGGSGFADPFFLMMHKLLILYGWADGE